MGHLLFVGLVLGTWTINIANCGLLSEPTQRHSVGYNEQPPAPTRSIETLELGLAERQPTKLMEHTLTLTIAGDSTCGFLSGSPGNAITCENGQPCFWEQEYIAAIFCGTGTNAEVHTMCVDRETALNPELCNDVCQGDRLNLRCTNTASPYCLTYVYPGSIHDFRCISTIVPKPRSLWFTHSEEKDRDFSTILWHYQGPSMTSNGSVTIPATSSTTTTSPPKSKDDGSLNIGAIVGTTIAGFVVLALLALGAFWLLRRFKTRYKSFTQPASSPAQLAWAPPVDPRIVNPGMPPPVCTELPGSTTTVLSATNPPSQYHEMSGANPPRRWEMPG